jgi:hypothetical protein
MIRAGLVLAAVLAISSGVFAQGKTPPAPLPPETLGPQLIVWSETQKPQPLVQPSASADIRPVGLIADPNDGEPAIQVFIGAIRRDGDSCVLKLADTVVYRIDGLGSNEKQSCEEGQARVLGVVDKQTSLYPLRIEMLSD